MFGLQTSKCFLRVEARSKHLQICPWNYAVERPRRIFIQESQLPESSLLSLALVSLGHRPILKLKYPRITSVLFFLAHLSKPPSFIKTTKRTKARRKFSKSPLSLKFWTKMDILAPKKFLALLSSTCRTT